MFFYRFYNQYKTLLYIGEHDNEETAWAEFFKHCKWPEHAQDINKAKEMGIYFVNE